MDKKGDRIPIHSHRNSVQSLAGSGPQGFLLPPLPNSVPYFLSFTSLCKIAMGTSGSKCPFHLPLFQQLHESVFGIGFGTILKII